MRVSPGIVMDILDKLNFCIDDCEWVPDSQTKYELEYGRHHVALALKKLEGNDNQQ